MSQEKTDSIDQIVQTDKIKLVVVEDQSEPVNHQLETVKAQSSPAVVNAPARVETEPAPLLDPEKVQELPIDEYFRVLEAATPEQLQTLIHSFEKTARTKNGSKLISKIISVPPEPRKLFSLFLWWELRRPLYTLIIGLLGLPSIFTLSYVCRLPLPVALISGICYLFWANVCYTLGTPAEVVARTIWKDKAETFGPVLLTLGTIFSIVLTVVLEVAIVGFMLLDRIGIHW